MTRRLTRTGIVMICVAIALGMCIVDAFAARLRVMQDSARPGDAILVDLGRQRVTKQNPFRAVFGDSVSGPVRQVDNDQLEIVVPLLPVGESTVSVYQGNRLLGRGVLQIHDTQSRRLTLAYSASGIQLVGKTRSAAPLTGHVRSRQPRLSFDLVNAQGAVVYSGTILDPQRVNGEVPTGVYDGGRATIGRPKSTPSTILFVDVPTPPGPVTIIFYRAEANLDLFTTEGRGKRTPLGVPLVVAP